MCLGLWLPIAYRHPGLFSRRFPIFLLISPVFWPISACRSLLRAGHTYTHTHTHTHTLSLSLCLCLFLLSLPFCGGIFVFTHQIRRAAHSASAAVCDARCSHRYRLDLRWTDATQVLPGNHSAHTHTHTHTHSYIHTYVHTHTHSCPAYFVTRAISLRQTE